MTQEELIDKIRELRQIKPNRDWVFLTKDAILGKESASRDRVSVFSVLRGLFFKPAYAGLLFIFVLFGLFGFAQNSLPGDLLYPLKRITEKVSAIFVSENEKQQISLELTNKRLEELTKIVKTKQVRKLASAINEFQASVSEAAKNLSKIETASSDPLAIKRVVDEVKKIETKAKEVKSLGVVIEEEELQELQEASSKLELELLVRILENMIADLENRTLTEKQEEILLQMKELIEQGKYSEALELYLINQ